jgi:hypothetical protein
MTEEQRDLYLSVKGCVESGDWDNAIDNCQQYVNDYPFEVNGWLYYLMAYNNVSSLKELAKKDVDIRSCPVYLEAIDSLTVDGQQAFEGKVIAIEKLRPKTGGNSEYDQCMQYFVQTINIVKRKIESLSQDAQSVVDSDKQALKNTKKTSASFFANNVFNFLLVLAGVMFPMGIVSVTLFLSGSTGIVPFVPVLVGVCLVLFITISNLKKARGYSRAKTHLKESCDLAEQTLVSLSKEIKTLDSKRKKLLKIYKTLKSRPKLNSASIEKLRTRFDKVYLEDDKALDV